MGDREILDDIFIHHILPKLPPSTLVHMEEVNSDFQKLLKGVPKNEFFWKQHGVTSKEKYKEKYLQKKEEEGKKSYLKGWADDWADIYRNMIGIRGCRI